MWPDLLSASREMVCSSIDIIRRKRPIVSIERVPVRRLTQTCGKKLWHLYCGGRKTGFRCLQAFHFITRVKED